MTYTIDQISELLLKAQTDGVPLQPVEEYVIGGIKARQAESIQAQNRKAPWENHTPGGPGGPLGESIVVSLARMFDKEVPEWSYYPYRRDSVLRKLWKQEPTMASAIYSMSSRIQSLDYEFNAEYGSSKQLRKAYERLLVESEYGKGFYVLRQKMAQDLLTQDNGVFILS